MKKNEKKFRRVLALVLAVALVATSGMFSSGNWLRATDEADGFEELAASTEQELTVEAVEQLDISDPASEEGTEPESTEAVSTETESEQTDLTPAETETPAEQPGNAEGEEPEEGTTEETGTKDPVEPTEETTTEMSEEEGQTEKKEKTPEMPAQTLTARAGSTVVTVTAPEGVLPAGTTMKAVPVTSETVYGAVSEKLAQEGRTLLDVVAIDITLYDKDGKEIQPKGKLEVTFGNVSASEGAEQAAVFHVDQNNSSAEKITEVSADADQAGFSADHFSVYVYATSAAENDVDNAAKAGENADYTMTVGEEITINGQSSTWSHTWTLNEEGIVRFTSTSRH